MDMNPGTQDFRGDLSGLFLISARAYTIRIESMDMKIGTVNIRGTPPISNLTGLMRAYAIRIESMDMKIGTLNIRGSPPNSNLTGLMRAYAIRIDSMDMKIETLNFAVHHQFQT